MSISDIALEREEKTKRKKGKSLQDGVFLLYLVTQPSTNPTRA